MTFNYKRVLVVPIKNSKIFILALSLLASGSIFGQNQKISLPKGTTTLQKVFQEIEKQTDLSVDYNQSKLNINKQVVIKEQNKTLSKTLEEVLAGSGLTFKIEAGHILILPLAEKKEVSTPDKQIKGNVTDKNGEPIIGANITVKGTTIGTITDIDGSFSFKIPDNATLLISYIGYLPQSISVGNQASFQITLLEDTQKLDEVVVIGYGTQKKVNLTGSVGVVDNQKLQNRSISNVGQALQGAVANLNITNNSGAANDIPDINVRGYTSINGGSPLIIIDGIVSDAEILSRMNPTDIESVSVLKDASSSAIYGSRAAFGVLLITTKKGSSEKLSINYNNNFALRHITRQTELETDPYTIATIRNTMGYPWYTFYTTEELEYAKKRSLDPENTSPYFLKPDGTYTYFDSVDWYEEAYKNVGFSTTQSIDISGKTERLSYFFSGSYFYQGGMLKQSGVNDQYNRYNLRTKLDFKITDWWNIGGNVAFASSDYDEPSYLDDLYRGLQQESTLTALRNPDGSWAKPNLLGPSILAKISDGGRTTTVKNDYNVQLSTKIDIIKKVLTIRGNFGLNRYNSRFRSSLLPVELSDGPNRPVVYTRATSKASNTSSIQDHILFDVYGEFTKTFKEKHYVQALIGFNQEETKYNILSAARDGLISNSLPSVNLATGEMTVGEKITSEAFRGTFFRFNYIFNDKYLVEFNGRYDGTSSFPKKDRFVFNPSASLGWIVSQEKFFQPITPIINHLKIRASYGSLGNQASGSNVYRYIPTMPSGKTSALLNGEQPVYVSAPGLVAGSLTWETVTTANFGFDLNFFGNRLTTSTDIYRRDTKNMLTKGKVLPSVLGASEPDENAADLKTKGWDLTIGWKDRFKLAGKDFHYSANFILSDNRTFITKFDNPTGSLSSFYVGKEIGEIWGAKTLGFFTSKEDIKNHADQSFVTSYPGTRPLEPGDLKFADLNNDGKIDYGKWTLDDHGDYKVIGNSTPRYNFSLSLNAEWNGFDIQTFFQGVGKRNYRPQRYDANFWGMYTQPWDNLTKGNLDYWTEDNPDAYFPRLKAYIAEVEDKEAGVPQTRYLQNAAYLRFKNLTIGYTLPKKIVDKLNISRLRIYFSGDNIAEITGLYKHYKVDPENLGGGSYPFQRTFSFGLNVSF